MNYDYGILIFCFSFSTILWLLDINNLCFIAIMWLWNSNISYFSMDLNNTNINLNIVSLYFSLYENQEEASYLLCKLFLEWHFNWYFSLLKCINKKICVCTILTINILFFEWGGGDFYFYSYTGYVFQWINEWINCMNNKQKYAWKYLQFYARLMYVLTYISIVFFTNIVIFFTSLYVLL